MRCDRKLTHATDFDHSQNTYLVHFPPLKSQNNRNSNVTYDVLKVTLFFCNVRMFLISKGFRVAARRSLPITTSCMHRSVYDARAK